MEAFTDGSYLTRKGKNLIAKVLAGQTTLTFTKATVGCGTIPDGLTPETMTDLGEYIKDGLISSINNPDIGEVAIVVQVSSIGATSGFFVTELGLWAEDPDEGEILYTYMSLQEHPEWIRSQSAPVSKLASFTLWAIVDTVQLVTAQISPDSFVTVKMLENYAPVVHKHALSDITEFGEADTFTDLLGLWDWTIDGGFFNEEENTGSDGQTIFDLLGLTNLPINGGDFIANDLAAHNASATAHSNLLVDGSSIAITATGVQTLEEHTDDDSSHSNITVDGN